jgi:hypothetical protein
VPLPQPGGCGCGAVRYRLNAAPLLAFACHCHDCQTRSGAAFSLTLVIRAADFQHDGPVEPLRGATRSGREIEHGCCARCRVPMFAHALIAPDFMSLRAGTLDDAAWVVPIVQTFVDSAIPWAVIPGVRAESWEGFDYAALGREWIAAAPRFERAPSDINSPGQADRRI